MTHEWLTPDEFARLMALREDHPDRRRAAASPQFEAMRCMLEDFERATAALPRTGDVASAERELMARLRDRLGAAEARGRTTGQAGRAPTTDPARSRESFLSRVQDWIGRPAGRLGLSLAALAIVAGVSLWLSRPHEPGAVRAIPETGGLVLAEPRATSGGVVLSWSAVPGADRFRVIFYGAGLAEIARLDGLSGTQVELRRDALPPGLASSQVVAVEVTALKGGDVVATSPSRQVRLP